mgnify:CR=1 FL=1
MATSKTGSFYLTETIILPGGMVAGTRVQGTTDLGAYVNVPTGQAIAIESVDFITQNGADFGGDVTSMLTSVGSISMQLTDLNPGTALIRADNDLYPDNFGPVSLSEAFLVVNDTLYLVGGVDSANIGAQDVAVSVRIRCRVVKLSTKDWMAIAIQSTAADN